jgi:hypothetical protein
MTDFSEPNIPESLPQRSPCQVIDQATIDHVIIDHQILRESK